MHKVIVVGSGNAAMCAALAAAQQGAKVTIIEAAPQEEFGGNSRYTAGALRFSYENRNEILEILDEETTQDDRIAISDFGSYPAATFLQELTSAAEGAANNKLHRVMVAESRPTMLWLKQSGVRFTPIYERQAYKIDGKYVFWGGLTLAAEDEGEGLIRRQAEIAAKLGIEFIFDSPVKELLYDSGRVTGVVYQSQGNVLEITTDEVILACGGFEANVEQRQTHIGSGWDCAKVRGTKYNQGDGLTMAIAIGAKTCGNWGGCHAVFMDANSPDYGNLNMPHKLRKNYRKISYPFGIMINKNGKRFVDEGADFRNYTYAKYGREVLAQSGRFAWQIFDNQVVNLLYEEYKMEDATRVTASSLEDLVAQLDDVDKEQALKTLNDYNSAVDTSVQFNPTIKDGKATKLSNEGSPLSPPKSNWATSLTEPPFTAYKVTCGITFTYGGLAINEHARVLDKNNIPIPGLLAAGEMVGDIFHHNYPGGSGLTSGAVFGRIAGITAGKAAHV